MSNNVQRKVSVQHSAVEGMDTELLKIILEGNLETLPPLSTRLVRVFISSTFSDMTHERNALMEHVYHKLKTYCQEKHRLEFQMMDLRWGLREESQDNHTIIEFCIREIKNCTQRSIGPNFVALLGQKYGYRSFPSTIDAKEFEMLRGALLSNGKDISLLNTWFREDLNTHPTVYVLLPISSIIKHSTTEEGRSEWEKIFRQLHHLLRLGVLLCLEQKLMATKEKDKYFISVTEYEIMKGLEDSKQPSNTMLCFTRSISNLQQHLNHRKIKRYIDMLPDKEVVDMDAQQMLIRLKKKIEKQLENSANLKHFSVKWSDPENKNPNDDEEYLKKFCQSFEERIKMLVDRGVASRRNFIRNTQVTEVHQHLNTCRIRSQVFRGRLDVMNDLKSYLSTPSKQPFILHGLSGCGKTSVLAMCASLLKEWFPKDTPSVIIRFLGTTSLSCSIRLVLYNLCWQLLSIDHKDTSGIPKDYPNLVKLFHQLIQKTEGRRKRVVLLLDSIDQLSQAHRAHNLAWLPKCLPDHFHIILSTLPHEYDLLENLKVLYGGKTTVREIKPLGVEVSLSLVQEWLSMQHKSLTPLQLSVVNEALNKCSLPLYARLVFEEVCRWNSFTNVDTSTLPLSIKGIINKLLDNLEKVYGVIFVKYTLSYLTASKNGLSDVELEDVLSLDDDVLNDVFEHWLPPVRRIPPLLLPRLHDALQSYLMEREANGVIVYYWYHRQFIFVARERYMKNEGHKHYIHSSLAHYYLGTWGGGKPKPCLSALQILKNQSTKTKGQEDSADRKVPLQPLWYSHNTTSGHRISFNLRKLSELPYHLIESRRFLDLHQEVLLNYRWLHSKLTAMSLQEVLSDFRNAIEAGDNHNEVNLVFNALRLGGSYLNHNPNTLAFDLLGRLLHCYNDKFLGIRSLLQQCDEQSREHSALLPLRQCFDPPKAMLLYVLEDHSHQIVSLLFTPTELFSISTDGIIASWDMSTGECTKTTSISDFPFGSLTKMYASENFKLLVVDCDAPYSPVYIFDLKTLHLLRTSGRRLHNQIRGFLSGNILCRQKNFIDIQSGETVKSIDSFLQTKRFVECKVTPDEKFILIGEDNTAKLYDFDTAGEMATFTSNNPICVIEITSNSKKAYCGYMNDCVFKVFDIDTQSHKFGSVIKTLDYKALNYKFHEGRPEYCALNEIAISPIDSDVVVLCVKRCNLLYLNVNSQQPPVLLETKAFKNISDTGFTNVTFNYNSLLILACFRNQIVIWKEFNKLVLNTIKLHSSPNFPWSLSTTHDFIASSSNMHTAINVWDLQKVDFHDDGNIVNYEGPVDLITPIPLTRCFVVKRVLANNKSYKYMDSFGLDIWNLATGHKVTFLKFKNYGQLLQVDVSTDGRYMALLVSNKETYITIYNFKEKKKILEIDVKNCKSFSTSQSWDYLCAYSCGEGQELVSLYRIKEKKCIFEYNARCPVFSYDDQSIIFISDGSALVYSLNTLAPSRFIGEDCGSLIPIPAHPHLLLINKKHKDSAELWDLNTYKMVFSMERLSESGIVDVSGDGRIAVDSKLQVFDLTDGTIKWNFNDETEEEKSFNLVRLTSDGNFLIWVDEYTAKVASVQSGCIVATTCTHEKPSSMALLDHGYVQVFGREDGRLLTTKFLLNLPSFKPLTGDSRTEFLLNIECGITEDLDETLKFNPISLKDSEMPCSSESLMVTLMQRCKKQRFNYNTTPKTYHSRSGSTSIETRDMKCLGTSPRLKHVISQDRADSFDNLEDSVDNLNMLSTPSPTFNNTSYYTFNQRSKSMQDILSTKKNRVTSPSPVRNVFSTLRSKFKKSNKPPPAYQHMMLFNNNTRL